MKNRSIATVAALLLTTVALSITACSSSDDKSATGSSATSATNADNGFQDSAKGEQKDQGAKAAPTTTPPNLPKPSAQELNDKINKSFDQSIPGKDKIAWIENADQDPTLVDKLAAAAAKNGVKVTITKVEDPSGGRVKADADVTMNGTPVNGASVPFVASGDQWKVDHQYACSIVKQAKLDSAACQS